MPPSKKDVMKRIQANATEVRSAATELTKQVKRFEAWLTKLPGRVSASCRVSVSADGNYETYLSFERHGKEWALVVAKLCLPTDETYDDTLLRDAPVETKMWMIPHFPALLEAIAKRQEEVAQQARESSREFDVIARELGIEEGA